MKSIKYILASILLSISAILPAANASALNGAITRLTAYVDGSNIHTSGWASGGTLAVALEVFDETGTTQIGMPETAATDVSYSFDYVITGDFNENTTYKVCAADFDGGEKLCVNTVKTIKTVNLNIISPKIGDEVKEITENREFEATPGHTIEYQYVGPDKTPVTSTTDSGYSIQLSNWGKPDDYFNYFYGTFEKDKDYYAVIDLEADEDIIFADTLNINLANGTLVDYQANERWAYIVVKLTASEDGKSEKATVADTGIAPKVESADKATQNISLGVSVVVASAILYGAHLIIKSKRNA